MRVQYEGVSRMTTSLKRRHRDRVVRRGSTRLHVEPRTCSLKHALRPCVCTFAVGMIIESDFYRTEAGRKHFTMQLDSIRYCVQETCSAAGMSNPSNSTISLPAMCAQTSM